MTTTTPTSDKMELPQTPLHGWLPIADVAEHLGMKKDTVYHAVINAAELSQDWVKQGAYPAPGGPRRWLINTDSEVFHYHQRRWQRLMEKQKARIARLRAIPPLPDFPFDIDEDDNPLDRQEHEEETGYPFVWQSPFMLNDAPFVSPPHAAPQMKSGQIRWKRDMIGLSVLALLQLVTLACILKRQPARGSSDS